MARRPSARNPENELTAKVIRERYEKGAKAVRAKAHDYWLNMAFIGGSQWLWYNPETRRLDELGRDPDRVQATVNLMRPATRSIIAKAVSRTLHFDVSPNSADDSTIRGAKLAQAAVTDAHREHDWERLREDGLRKAWKGGTAIIAVDWDAQAGTRLSSTENGTPVGTGDTKETVHAIVEVGIEPGVRDAERARWWVRAQALPPEQVQATFGMDKAPAADATAGMTPFQQKLVAEHTRQGTEAADLTLVLTYYERPNKLRPQGAIASVVGETIVDGPHAWYFPWTDRLNFAVIRETPDDDTWTGDTVLNDARYIQTAYNASWSSIIEHMKMAGNARLAIPQSTLDLMDTLTDMAGEFLPYPDQTEKPAYVSPPQMPAWWIEQPEKLRATFDDTVGLHEVSRGDAPPNIESGLGIQILAEQDSTPLGRLVKEDASAWGKVASMVLKLIERKATETRTARIVIPGQPPESATYTGKDFDGQTTAIVPEDAVMPRSRAAQQAFAQKAMEMGLITTLAQFARVAELPGQDDLIEAAAPDVAKARRENYLLANGKVVIPDDFDDDETHIQEHNDFRKSARYSLLDEATRKIVDDHVQAHATQAAEQLGAQETKGLVSPLLAAAPTANGAPTIPVADAASLAAGGGPATAPAAPGATDLPPAPGGEAPPADLPAA